MKVKLDSPLKKGIVREWFLNFYIILFAAVVLLEIILCFTIRSFFYDRLVADADRCVRDFSLLSTYDAKEFEVKAQEYAENFEFKDLMEVQVYNGVGKCVVSTTGFTVTDSKPQDYLDAFADNSGSAVFEGESNSGESILAKTVVLSDIGHGSNGAIRYIVSTETVSRSTTVYIMIAIVFGIAVLIISYFSGTFFAHSIIKPVAAVNEMTRKISLGNFDTKLEVGRKDELGELCESINTMADELQSAENLKNDFISSVSHELRTPLTAIRGWGETAKMSLGSDPELVEKGLDVVLNEASRLSELVEDLLDFSRMQSGNFKIDARPLLVSSILHECVDMYAEFAKQKSIDLTYLPPTEESNVLADFNRIKQVFINIIDNAIKYTEGAGQVLISQFEEDGCVTVKINDTGVGIPEAAIDRVKEKFFRCNKSTATHGSGIGLAVADEIIKQHNGLLFLESSEGVGTTVTVVLPITEATEESVDELHLAPTDEIENLEANLQEAIEEKGKEETGNE